MTIGDLSKDALERRYNLLLKYCACIELENAMLKGHRTVPNDTAIAITTVNFNHWADNVYLPSIKNAKLKQN